jgi:uncharacterized membrane protein
MDGPYFMDAVITPHRSLSSRGFIILIAILTTINAASAVMFFAMGAAPVPIFLGLDVTAVVIAFAVSNRAAANHECVRVTAQEVCVIWRTPRGERVVWVSPTRFTRVVLMGAEGQEDDLHICQSDKALRLARALSRPERLAFASALDRAIWRARRGVDQAAI